MLCVGKNWQFCFCIMIMSLWYDDNNHNKHYSVYKFAWLDYAWMIWVKVDRPSVVLDSQTSWPCWGSAKWRSHNSWWNLHVTQLAAQVAPWCCGASHPHSEFRISFPCGLKRTLENDGKSNKIIWKITIFNGKNMVLCVKLPLSQTWCSGSNLPETPSSFSQETPSFDESGGPGRCWLALAVIWGGLALLVEYLNPSNMASIKIYIYIYIYIYTDGWINRWMDGWMDR